MWRPRRQWSPGPGTGVKGVAFFSALAALGVLPTRLGAREQQGGTSEERRTLGESE